jgi:hypothetical protein
LTGVSSDQMQQFVAQWLARHLPKKGSPSWTGDGSPSSSPATPTLTRPYVHWSPRRGCRRASSSTSGSRDRQLRGPDTHQ